MQFVNWHELDDPFISTLNSLQVAVVCCSVKNYQISFMMSGNECIHAAQRLFEHQYQIDNPLVVELAAQADITELKKLCDAFGITLK